MPHPPSNRSNPLDRLWSETWSRVAPLALDAAERGRLPDPVIRLGIRALLRERLLQLSEGGSRGELVHRLARGPIAEVPDRANEQHYEVTPEFFRIVLGPRLKYSCAWYDDPGRSLAEAEEAMLARTFERAGLAEGQRVLDLGCGWGSVSLGAAERFPGSRFVAVSNSKDQGEWIRGEADRRGLRNLDVLTADANEFDAPSRGLEPFDCVISVEMFEHMRNWQALLGRIAGWLAPGGRVFLHTFCHRDEAYLYEDQGAGDWMARHFFSGGMMPSADWIHWNAGPFRVVDQWFVRGTHYARTSEDWLRNLDRRRDQARAALAAGGDPDPDRALGRWRLFFLACAELFAAREGREWFVQHALLEPRSDA